VLPRGGTRTGVQLDIINNLLRPAPDANGARVVEDNETQRLLFSWRKGVAPQTELGVFVPLLARNGGILDAPIDAYHRLWSMEGSGLDNPQGREAFPNGESILFYRNPDGQGVNAGSALGLGDVSLTIKRELSRSRRAALAVRAGAKLPTGSAGKLLGSGGFDFGLMLDGRYQLGREWIAYGNFGGVLLGDAGNLPGAEKYSVQGLLALEYRKSNRDSYFFQIDANSRVLTPGHSFADGAPVSATLGYKRVLDSRRILAVSFSENGDYHNYRAPVLGNIGPDFTLTLGLEWRR